MGTRRCWRAAAVLSVGLACGASAAVDDPDDLADVADHVPGAIEHCDEAVAGRVFTEIFDCGDELFETEFNAIVSASSTRRTRTIFSRS